MTTYTNDCQLIQLALASHERSFVDLESQMDTYRPLPLEAFEAKWQSLWDRMRPINDELTDDKLRDFIDSQIRIDSSPEMQFTNSFYDKFVTESVSITILAHALIEAAINTILALGLNHVGRLDLFDQLERKNLKHKWATGPKEFLPDYGLSKSGSLYNDLTTICRRRNAYVHAKVDLSNPDGRILLRGSGHKAISLGPQSRRLLHKALELPYSLHDCLLNQVADRSLRFMLESVLKR